MLGTVAFSTCLMALVVALGTGITGNSGGSMDSYSPNSTPPSYSDPAYHYSPNYTDARRKIEEYGQEFNKLLSNFKYNENHIPGTNVGIDLDDTKLTLEDWNEFCKLKNENEEFNIYAGELLYSQAENYFAQLKTHLFQQTSTEIDLQKKEIVALIMTVGVANLIAEELKLYPQHNRAINGQVYQLKTILESIKTYDPPTVNLIKQLVKIFIDSGLLLINDSSALDAELQKIITSPSNTSMPEDDKPSYKEDLKYYLKMVQNTVKGSLAFWHWKQNRRYENCSITIPPMLDNGNRRCWLQTGFYMLCALTATDNLDELGNWGKFLKYIRTRQLNQFEERVKNIRTTYPNIRGVSDNTILGIEYKKEPWHLTINLVNVLKDFCNTRYDYNLFNNSNTVKKELNYLESPSSNKGGTTIGAIDIFKKIFPELNRKKFNTGECLCEEAIDPILSVHTLHPKPKQKEYNIAHIAIRHLIPGLHNENDGIGKDPAGVSCTNQYGEYKLKISPDGKLLIYELKGIALDEHLPEFKKIPHDQTSDGQDQYSVLPSCHGRSVIKLDASPNWYYCDSNGIYFGAKNLQDLFRDKRSIVNYNTHKNASHSPANHADLLMYQLIDNKLWTERSL